jgi:hypothetical protein
MSPLSDDELIGALRRRPVPVPPPVDGLLARAFPEPAPGSPTPARRHLPAPAFAAAALLAAALPLVLPTSDATRAWGDGLARRGLEFSTAVLEHFGKE